VYSDTWGPAQVKGVGGYRYFELFIDDYTRLTTLYLEERGIERSLTVHDTPEHNGIAERANYTILDLGSLIFCLDPKQNAY